MPAVKRALTACVKALEGLRVVAKDVSWSVAAAAGQVGTLTQVTPDGGGCPQGLSDPRTTLFVG